MSAVEVQNEYLNNQNDYLQQQNESEGQRRVQEQADQELQNSITSIREAQNIDEQTWQETQEMLSKTSEEGETVTPELVADTIKYSRMYDQAESVVNASAEQITDQEEWIEQLVNVKEKYPDFTDEDLTEVLNRAVKDAKKSSAEQKLVKKVESKKAPAKKINKQKSLEDDYLDDIDPELEDFL